MENRIWLWVTALLGGVAIGAIGTVIGLPPWVTIVISFIYGLAMSALWLEAE